MKPTKTDRGYLYVTLKGENSMKRPEDVAWELFEKTGKTGYYMLYKKLKNKQKETIINGFFFIYYTDTWKYFSF